MPDIPYAGLMPFSEEQAPFFFGRDDERDIITANLLAARLTLLYGPSGVGKSSVLNAGVVHRLRDTSDDVSESPLSHVVVPFRSWRDEPLASLESTIQKATGAVPHGDSFAERLHSTAEQIDGDVLLILDQFEEFFLYHAGREAGETFATEFAKAVNRRGLRASFLLSMREDSIAKLDFFKGHIPNLFDNYLRIGRLRSEQGRDAIVGPLAEFNRRFAPAEGAYSIEPQLVEEVLEQVRTSRVVREGEARGASGTDDSGIETPHLQLVMTRLWNEERAAGSRVLRLETLRRLGGASEIVRRHVDSALDALTPDERETAAKIFQYLVTPAGTKIALGVEDLAPNAGTSPADLNALLVKLSAGDRRILTPVAPAPDQPYRERYQIFHDVLAEKVLGWRMRYVAAAERRAAEERAREEHLRAEREAQTSARLRRLLAGVVVLLAITGAAAWFAWQQTRTAQAERLRADRATQTADLATIEANEEKALAQVSAARARESEAANRRLQETNLKLEQELAAERAQQAGRAAEAAALRKQAAATAARADEEAKKERQAREDAERAAAAAEAARTRREELEQEIRQQQTVTTAAEPPPSKQPIEVPPESKAAPPPAADPSPPPRQQLGNYRTIYRQAIEAKNRRRWAEAARLMESAIQVNPTDSGEQVNISGAGNFEPYVPNYYLGVAYSNLGDCARALEAWERSEAAGAIRNTSLYRSLQEERARCAGAAR